jgi:hypothetical protein
MDGVGFGYGNFLIAGKDGDVAWLGESNVASIGGEGEASRDELMNLQKV